MAAADCNKQTATNNCKLFFACLSLARKKIAILSSWTSCILSCQDNVQGHYLVENSQFWPGRNSACVAGGMCVSVGDCATITCTWTQLTLHAKHPKCRGRRWSWRMADANMIESSQQITDYYIEIYIYIFFFNVFVFPSLSGFRSLALVLALLWTVLLTLASHTVGLPSLLPPTWASSKCTRTSTSLW